MRFSVVIPTYNRSEKLKLCLQVLRDQNFDKKNFEIVVVDDGSQDDTQSVLNKIKKNFPVPMQVLYQPNQGQGAARNHGIEKANGEIVLLLGDDIIATNELLKEHDRAHRAHPEENAAVLGFITWHPKLHINNLMRFSCRGGAIFGRFGGHQFAFDLLRNRDKADYRFFYTSNISLKRSLLLRFKFDPWFSGYGWEDIELGYRLTQKAALTIYYRPSAIAYHDHMMDENEWAGRMRTIGRSSHLIHARYPELGRIPSKRKKMIFRFLSNPLSLKLLKKLNKNLYFYGLSKKYFLEGLGEGYNEIQH